jgi:undecaprenyl-diphosphatase
MFMVAASFVISGVFLFAASRIKKNKSINLKNTFMVGLAQALAIIPGVSRSGATISTGILMGIKKQEAIRFSFLLAIPAIMGATALKMDSLSFNYSLIIPFLITFSIGLASIHLLMKFIKQENLKYFAYYCWFVAILILVLKILGII